MITYSRLIANRSHLWIIGGISLLCCIGYIFIVQNQIISEQSASLRKLHAQLEEGSSSSLEVNHQMCRPYCMPEPSWIRENQKKHELVKFMSALHEETPEEIPTYKKHKGHINEYAPLSKKVDMARYKKKVFLDLGGRDGDSIAWFYKHYPKASEFTEVWVFEADPQFNKDHVGSPYHYFNLAVWIRNETMYLGNKGVASSIVVDTQPNKKAVEAFDFSEFLATHFDYDDFVVCKMDIEGVEFQLIPKLLADLTIFKIDELMLECHYYEWTKLFPNILRKDCLNMINNLRNLTLYVHEWN